VPSLFPLRFLFARINKSAFWLADIWGAFFEQNICSQYKSQDFFIKQVKKKFGLNFYSHQTFLFGIYQISKV
jgi:hypothetical protein